jgi:hypothetical protein
MEGFEMAVTWAHDRVSSVINRLTHCTVRLDCSLAGGETSCGTGFYFNFLSTKEHGVSAIVTNRHVVAGAISANIHVTFANESGEPDFGSHELINIPDFERHCHLHPDEDVDLAILPCGRFLRQMISDGRPVYSTHLDERHLAPPDFMQTASAMEEVIMVGYPIGLWDESNNLPILRRGVTATPVNRDYQGRREFVIDAACFPGSSGSPVFYVERPTFELNGGRRRAGSEGVALLGILWGGPQLTAKGEIVVTHVPTATLPIAQTRIPTNLGYCIKAERLLDFNELLLSSGEVPQEHIQALRAAGRLPV